MHEWKKVIPKRCTKVKASRVVLTSTWNSGYVLPTSEFFLRANCAFLECSKLGVARMKWVESAPDFDSLR